MTPIEQVMATVEWTPSETQPTSDGTPYATHSGVLEIAGHKLRCYRLNDGRAIFAADDLLELFGGLS